MNKIHVIGIGFKPLEKDASSAVLQSDAVLVNSRLLEVFKGYKEYESVRDKILVHGSVYETLDYIGDNYKEEKLSLLAAGDPMFFGIGRLVIERLGQEDVVVCPDLSSMQIAFSRVKETSNNALLISLHGGPDPKKRRQMEYDISELPGLISAHGKVGILTDKVNSPEIIAETIKSAHPDCTFYVCEKLGYQDEQIIKGTPEEISKGSFEHPNVVIIVQRLHTVGAIHELPLPMFGLKEDEIQHSKGLITKDEVRAVTIHNMRLPREGVLWDIGAGSGSVSIEAALLCPSLKVFAIEKNDEQIKYITRNKNSFKTSNVEIIQGAAPHVLDDLPVPDRIFIGGSAGKLNAIVSAASKKMTSGIIVINAATIETLNDAVKGLGENGFTVNISEVSVSRSKTIGNKRHMSALNPVFIVSGERD